MEYQKLANLLDNIPDKVTRFFMINLEEHRVLANK